MFNPETFYRHTIPQSMLAVLNKCSLNTTKGIF